MRLAQVNVTEDRFAGPHKSREGPVRAATLVLLCEVTRGSQVFLPMYGFVQSLNVAASDPDGQMDEGASRRVLRTKKAFALTTVAHQQSEGFQQESREFKKQTQTDFRRIPSLQILTKQLEKDLYSKMS